MCGQPEATLHRTGLLPAEAISPVFVTRPEKTTTDFSITRNRGVSYA
jgi:hypothetical protein